jgi:hypothetical protein
MGLFGNSKPQATQIESSEERLNLYLNDGWQVKGYSTCMLELGGLTHSILLEKDGHLVSHTTLVLNGKATGSNEICLSSVESMS